jgi:hypothetical protein
VDWGFLLGLGASTTGVAWSGERDSTSGSASKVDSGPLSVSLREYVAIIVLTIEESKRVLGSHRHDDGAFL